MQILYGIVVFYFEFPKDKFKRKIMQHYSDKWFLEYQNQLLTLSILILCSIAIITGSKDKPLVDNFILVCIASGSLNLIYTIIQCYNPFKTLAHESQQEFALLEEAKGIANAVIKKSDIYVFLSFVFSVILSLDINLIIVSIFHINDINVHQIYQLILIFLIAVFIQVYKRMYLLSLFERRGEELSKLYSPNF